MSFICNECGSKYPKWVGRCSACGKWETITLEKEIASPILSGKPSQLVDISQIKDEADQASWATGVEEFDSIIGGGVMPASIGLLGGEPGIGKSTLILQLIGRLSAIGKKCIYVSGEETVLQIKARADRLLLKSPKIMVLIESEIEKIFSILDQEKPDFVVLDSIQTLFTSKVGTQIGSLTQIKESTFLLTQYAKQKVCSLLLVAHITKEGYIAGPKTIEHMVDYVLYLEGAPYQDYRYLRAFKNRFGSINDIGFFKMTPKGLAEVKDQNRVFMENYSGTKSGSIIFPATEGSKIILLEVQALVGANKSNFISRTTLGIERNRLLILLATLEKYLHLNLSNFDVYASISGGIKVSDTAVDMAILGAIYSNAKNILIKKPIAMIGEINLSGEFTQVKALKEKLTMLEQCGLEQCLFAQRKQAQALPNKSFNTVQNLKELASYLDSLK